MPHEAETRLFLVVESFRHRHSALMFSKYELLVFRNASIYIFNRDTHEIKENCCRNQVKGSYARACMLFCISGGETIIRHSFSTCIYTHQLHFLVHLFNFTRDGVLKF